MLSASGAETTGRPEVTVAICTRGRGGRIVPTIESVLDSVGVDMRVLIIDQSDDEETERALERFIDDRRIHYERVPTRGIGPARADAVDRAATETLLFTDDDCTVPRDWAVHMHKALVSKADIAMVFCNVVAAPHDEQAGFVPTYCRRGDLLVSTPLGKCRARGIGAGMAVRTNAVLEVGNFDTAFGSRLGAVGCEEGDLSLRLILRGWNVMETDRTFVVHDGFRTWQQGKQLTRRNFTGMGLAYAKPLRAGHFSALLVVLHEGLFLPLLATARSIASFRRPQLRGLVSFWSGFLRSFRFPVDRESMTYQLIND